MKRMRLQGASLVAPVLLVGLSQPAQAVEIVELLGTGGTATFEQTAGGLNATYINIDDFDIGLGFENDGCIYTAAGGFPGDACVTYSVTLNLTNNTDTPWTDFHLRVGYGGLWTDGNGDYPLLAGEEAFDQSNGFDQPLEFSNINLGGTAIPGTGDEDEANLGIFDVGIDWIFGTPIAINTGVALGFDVILGDVTGQTSWNTDFFGYPPDNPNGYALTARLYPTIAAVPEPGILALFAAGLVGLGFARRRHLH